MITRLEARKYKKIIGPKYANKVLEYFKTESITRDSGELYTAQDVRNAMNGRRYLDLQVHIIDAVLYYKEKNIEIEKKKKLLESA